MTQERYEHLDADRAASITNHPDPNEVPEDVKIELLIKHIVKAECAHCSQEHHYISLPRRIDQPTCLNPDCDHQIALP
ncbi:hypothetical protein [Natrinema sp. 1APR25-10V2]|uniref:hypothetical protein n=1 Tax=Natrinema sp. 1APR25-10V2 TaxID=2951081 RepID=UPI002875C396|nr:hypothetical protein [Natrinema sp. 1APR25-10V2]MDS0474371.1 hypothetical protein [Natrinema sp. 1APR25-10V2]